MTHQELWAAYWAVNPEAGEDYEPWAYGADPDGLAELRSAGLEFSPSMPVVCEEFEVVWPPAEPTEQSALE